MNKENKYQNILKTIEYSLKVNKNIRYLTLMCEIINLYKENFDYMHWVGFYLEDKDKNLLYLGPYIGDVHQLPYHIACSSTTNSEIVAPVMENDHCLAVFDIDSDNHAAFDKIDKKYTEKICQLLASQHSIFSQL